MENSVEIHYPITQFLPYNNKIKLFKKKNTSDTNYILSATDRKMDEFS